MNLHRQVEVEANGFRFDCDEGMAALVVALNEAGYRTVSSCEAFPLMDNQAYVGFMSLRRAERFRDLIGGKLIIPGDGDRAAAIASGYDDDDETNVAAAVIFAPDRIAEAVQKVEQKD